MEFYTEYEYEAQESEEILGRVVPRQIHKTIWYMKCESAIKRDRKIK